ncbi:hypothetical protein PG994_009082 [Apiospora phragmitis]|uniref:AAA+ ATPase domain-containing protein n=1 Tax=Apiospora phragmitis TaxID=2905665 RepID=A0ABR1UI98_9PEZI
MIAKLRLRDISVGKIQSKGRESQARLRVCPHPFDPVLQAIGPLVHPRRYAHWINREPEIRKRTGVDWISAYEQEPYDPDLDQFVVLYAFYDKEAKPPRPNGKADEEDGDTCGGDAWEDEEPIKIIIRSRCVQNELKEVLTQYWWDIKRHLGQLKEEASKLPNSPDSQAQEGTSVSGISESTLGLAQGPEDSVVIHAGGARAPASMGDRRHPLPHHQRRFVLSEEEQLRRRVTHLEMLVGFGEKALKRHLNLRAQVQDATLQQIVFNDLWHLYNPGDLLLADERGYPQLYMVYNLCQPPLAAAVADRGVDGTTPPRVPAPTAARNLMHCYALNVDSTGVGALCSRKQIKKYLGLKNVSDLPIYPLKFHKDARFILDKLQDRGRKFISCTGHRRYDGVIYDTRGIVSREHLQGEIYVDADEYARRRSSDVFIEKDPGMQELMTRDEALLMPQKLQLMQHSLQAFSFKSRSWVNIEIDNVETIDKSLAARESGFQDLLIPSKHRRLLILLVDNHAIRDDSPDDHARMNPKPSTQLDLVRGKGLGLIILLHGPPGSGKTSTTETIAAHTGRPLYAITCGDLGETLEDIETRLDVHSKRAEKWGAVLLLDEADVFLMKRDWKDTHRNAMCVCTITVFLRTLEYYQGIIFLTTNRVGVIDEAFKSRIHVSLRYPKVKLKSTLEIWKNMLNRIERDNERQDIKVEFDRDELLEFAEEHFEVHATTDRSTWNGRQIRNAFQTAIALGQYDRVAKIQKRGLTPEEAFLSGKKKWRVVQLTRKNLETLAETARDFDKYLKSVHRRSDGELARAEDLRDDEFSDFEEEAVGRKRPSGGRGRREEEAVGSKSFLSAGSAAKLKKGPAARGKKTSKRLESRSPRGPGTKTKGKQARRRSDSDSDSEGESEASTDRDRARAKSISESASDEESDD